MTDAFRRFFTLEEANHLLGQLKPHIEEMLDARSKVLELQPELEGVLDEALGNGGSKATGEALIAFERIRSALDVIHAEGVLVKDVNTGLLDFPSERNGRVVFLCWKHGEGQIEFWHDLDTGFEGRQPL